MGNRYPVAIFLAASALLATQAIHPSAALAGEGEGEAGGLKEWTTDQPIDDVGEGGEGEGEGEAGESEGKSEKKSDICVPIGEGENCW